MSGTLFLVPVPIGDGDPRDELAPMVLRTVAGLRDFIVENRRSARRFLSRFMDPAGLDASSLAELSEHTPAAELDALLEPLRAGRDAALVSEAGCPCVADPGSDLVAAAARAGIRVVPLPGPSSIVMALMASGMGGQRFSFLGYLPADPPGRARALRELEARSARDGSTQIFIETPYRSDRMAVSMGEGLGPDTLVCAASGIATAAELVIRGTAGLWRREPPALGKVPTVFLVSAAGAAAILPRPDPRPDRAGTPKHSGDARSGGSRPTGRKVRRPGRG